MKHILSAIVFLLSAISAYSQTEEEQKIQIFANMKERSIIGSLPAPSYSVQESGTVVVTVLVDKRGEITEATAGTEGTTIKSKELWDAAGNAAMKVHFNKKKGAPLQQGTITYIFNPKPAVDFGPAERPDDTADQSVLPLIQDTFFGMTITKEYTPDEIRHHVDNNGSFQSEAKEGGRDIVTFKDLYFGGRTWDRASFITAGNGGLLIFYVLDLMPDGFFYDAGQRDAERIYKDLKETLDDKYGETQEESGDGELSVTYSGSNGIDAIISRNRESVGIVYAKSSILSEIKEAARSEY